MPRRKKASEVTREMLTLTEACTILGASRSSIDVWRALGTAPEFVRYPNNTLHISRDSLNTWLAERVDA